MAESDESKQLYRKREEEDISLDVRSQTVNGESVGISRLKQELTLPFLWLLKVYLYHFNDQNLTLGEKLQKFRKQHPYVIRGIFLADVGASLVFLSILIFVAIRGLGIHRFVLSLIESCTF